MKRKMIKKEQPYNIMQEGNRMHLVNERYLFAAQYGNDEILKKLHSAHRGLHHDEVERSREKYGKNEITQVKKTSFYMQFVSAFINPFTIILLILAGVSIITDIIMVNPADRNYVTVLIITVMVIISGSLRFIQEVRSNNAADKLSKMIVTTACVERIEIGKQEIPFGEIVVGDIVHLSAGDMVPADVRMLYAKDLFISQSSLTGESEPQEKYSHKIETKKPVLEMENMAFMGSVIISGSAQCVVVAVGNDTVLGSISKDLNKKATITSFEKGVNSVSWVLIRFMLAMVPVVFVLNGFTKGDWMDAGLFAISIAVGLTPEMLPMIVTACLAKGAMIMSRKKVIVKNLNAIQNLGSMDILCTDKTGTLTQDHILIQYHQDIYGKEDNRILRYAFLNSYYQTGLKNMIDMAIIEKLHDYAKNDPMFKDIEARYTKVDEIPFDFNRRRMSVVIANHKGKRQMITKGAIEEMLKVCSFAECNDKIVPLHDEMRDMILRKTNSLNNEGMRVIAVAYKNDPSSVEEFSVQDENEMIFIGYLALLDPPKETTPAAIQVLKDYGVHVKVLTGDNAAVAKCICKQVGIDITNILLGKDIESMENAELKMEIEKTSLFAKLSPSQKARIIELLRENGHSVGYMGDGINDASAMKLADVGISVDTAVDIAKESADIILLEKSLMVLEDGIIEGRKTYANMIKYIKMTVSSNFGNMFSVLIASAFLPFLPMKSIHLILLNLIYDISCTAIPWDNVDVEFLKKPKNWDASSVSKFMLWIGPTSSLFDITTYIIMFFIICPMVCGSQFYELSESHMQVLFIALFQTGWFVESMWSQTFVIHMIRTPKIPFLQSRASTPVILLTFTGIALLTCLPYTPLGKFIGLAVLPSVYYIYLAVTIFSYMCLVTIMKKIYIKKYKELL